MKGKPVRVQLDISKEHLRVIEEAMEECGLATRKDFYENATELFLWAIETAKERRTIVSVNLYPEVDGEGTEREFVMPAILSVRRKHKA